MWVPNLVHWGLVLGPWAEFHWGLFSPDHTLFITDSPSPIDSRISPCPWSCCQLQLRPLDYTWTAHQASSLGYITSNLSATWPKLTTPSSPLITPRHCNLPSNFPIFENEPRLITSSSPFVTPAHCNLPSEFPISENDPPCRPGQILECHF